MDITTKPALRTYLWDNGRFVLLELIEDGEPARYRKVKVTESREEAEEWKNSCCA